MKKLWKFLEGKKTYFGAGFYIALAIFGKGLSPELLKALEYTLLLIFGISLSDKGRRMFKKPPKANI